jgi:hypothetical protein
VLEDSGCVLAGDTKHLSCEMASTLVGHIDVALIDLPRQNAVDAALARQLIARNIRVVLIAHDLADNLSQQLPASPPLTKPFTEQELLDRMVEAIDVGEGR